MFCGMHSVGCVDSIVFETATEDSVVVVEDVTDDICISHLGKACCEYLLLFCVSRVCECLLECLECLEGGGSNFEMDEGYAILTFDGCVIVVPKVFELELVVFVNDGLFFGFRFGEDVKGRG